jgi:DNA-binding PadR family transcriptional regulator
MLNLKSFLISVIDKLVDYEFKAIVLCTISGNEIYGLDILSNINPKTGKDYSIGKLYPTLSYLEQSGYVTGIFKEKATGTIARPRYYKLTSKGLDLFFIMNLFLA